MAQQHINLGIGVDTAAGDPDKVHEAMPKIQSNFDEIYSWVTSVLGGKIIEYPISLDGIDPTFGELKKVATAINNRANYTVPIGYIHVVSYYKPYVPGELTNYFQKDFYAVKRGAGLYGAQIVTAGNPVNSGEIIKLGTIISEPDVIGGFPDIGVTTIHDYINLNVPSIDFEGFSVVSATIGGVVRQYVFNGEDGNYGSASGNITTADNFIELTDDSISATSENVISSNLQQPTGVTTFRNIVTILQADYDAADLAGELQADTYYIITDAVSGGSGTDDQTAAEVPFTPASGLASTDLQALAVEIKSLIDANTTSITGLVHTAITSIDLKSNGNANEYIVEIQWTDEDGTAQTTTDPTPITIAGAGLAAADIDTLAELNAIVTDATLIDTADPRLSDARTPTAHTHVEADITDLDKYTQAQVDAKDLVIQNDINNHEADTTNPHSVTATQVGLGNVDNTSDANKPVSSATQTALDGKVDDAQVLTNVPAGAVFTDTQLTQEQVEDFVSGLITDGTNINTVYDDVSGTLTINASGGGLSQEEIEDFLGTSFLIGGNNIDGVYDDASNTYTFNLDAATIADITANTAKNSYPAADSSKLAGIAVGAEVNVQSDYNQTNTGADDYMLNMPRITSISTVNVSLTEGGEIQSDAVAITSTNINIASAGSTGYMAVRRINMTVAPTVNAGAQHFSGFGVPFAANIDMTMVFYNMQGGVKYWFLRNIL